MTQINQKLIVITRRDLSPGYQAVQSAHAAVDFQHQHPQLAKDWNTNSNYLIILSAKNEEQLKKYIWKFQKSELCHTVFREPDIGNEITAICVQPSEKTRKLTCHLPLALSEYFNDPLTENQENYSYITNS